MFDYEKFENDIVQQMTAVFNNWIMENEDIYIFSLDCASAMDSIGVIANTIHYLEEQADADSQDYWYYKYCEEEWDLFDTFETVSADMCKYLDDHTSIFDKHCDEIIEHCKNALIHFRQAINKSHSDILLTFNIREFLNSDEKIEIFQIINSESASKEYSEHIEEFA